MRTLRNTNLSGKSIALIAAASRGCISPLSSGPGRQSVRQLTDSLDSLRLIRVGLSCIRALVCAGKGGDAHRIYQFVRELSVRLFHKNHQSLSKEEKLCLADGL